MAGVIKEPRQIDDKKWAIGLNEKQFKVEFTKRYKHADCIPDRVEWVKVKERPPLRFVPPDPEKVKPKEINPNDLILSCSACKKEFQPFKLKSVWKPNKIGLFNHKKHCKKLLEQRS